MPISACGIRNKTFARATRVNPRQQGFTLIEIIVVVFIIGMAVGVISISVGGNAVADQARKEAEEFMLQAGYVAEQAILKGEVYGLFVELRPAQDIDGQEQWCYTWRRVRDREWQDLPELSPHCIVEGLVIEFTIDEDLWEYDPELEYQDPVIGFFPSGDASGEVEIAIFADQSMDGEVETQKFKLDLTGELHWINEEERLEAERKGL
jgi:general secretion pathway protein H